VFRVPTLVGILERISISTVKSPTKVGTLKLCF